MEGKSKEVRNSMKVKNGSVHRKRYNGCCMKQQVSSKGHLDITHSKEKVHMSNILLKGIFDEG